MRVGSGNVVVVVVEVVVGRTEGAERRWEMDIVGCFYRRVKTVNGILGIGVERLNRKW